MHYHPCLSIPLLDNCLGLFKFLYFRFSLVFLCSSVFWVTSSLLVEAKAKEDLALAEEKKKDELAQQARAFAARETALMQELSCLHHSEKDAKKRFFDKVQEYTELESKVLPLRTRVVELEEEAEQTKAKMAKLEERATNQEVQLGRVEGELT